MTITPSRSVKPPVRTGFTRFDVLKSSISNGCIVQPTEAGLSLDGFKKNRQSGNAASCYFQKLTLSKLLQLLLQVLRHRGNCVDHHRTAFQQTREQKRSIRALSVMVLQPACTVLLKYTLTRGNTYDQHLFIAFNTVRLEFRCFRPV